MAGFLEELSSAVVSTLKGMRVSLSTMFRPAITVKYPDERLDLPVGFREIPVLLTDPDGNLKCTSCNTGAEPTRPYRSPYAPDEE